jgi:hypothetical protein
VPGMLDIGCAMMAQRFGVDMHGRCAQELTRFQLIQRRSQRPPGSKREPSSLIHRSVLLVEWMRGAERAGP